MARTPIALASLALAAACADGVSAAATAGAADLILLNAGVVRLEPPGSTPAAVAIRGDTIAAVGGEAEALALKGPSTRVVDLAGFTLIPGLIDAHGHVSSLGRSLATVDLVGTASEAEAAARVREAARSAPPGSWIQGRGWDQNGWDRKEFPTRASLDAAAPGHPVALGRVDGHALWVSTKALEIAGVGRGTPEPEGGRILREADGSPQGVLVDNAMKAIEARIPAPDRDDLRRSILRALNRCLDAGLTGVHDAGIGPEEVAVYRELAASGRLPIRVYAMLGGTQRVLPDYFADPPIVDLGSGFFTLRAVKLGIDGALGSRGAALFDDYADAPGQRGLLTREPDRIREIAARAVEKGWQVCVHAIGDRGNALALTALEEALRGAPAGDRRFRIEHAQILRLQDIPRFRASGILPSMQPTHATSDMPWAESRVGAERIAGAYAWRRLLATGVRIPLGSDFPVESENPFLGLYAAVTRQDAEGRPPGGWRPEERMTIGEALKGFTEDAAYAAFEEKSLGAIAPGMKADIVVLHANLLDMPPAEIRRTVPAAVIVAGRVARSGPALRERLPLNPAYAAGGGAATGAGGAAGR